MTPSPYNEERDLNDAAEALVGLQDCFRKRDGMGNGEPVMRPPIRRSNAEAFVLIPAAQQHGFNQQTSQFDAGVNQLHCGGVSQHGFVPPPNHVQGWRNLVSFSGMDSTITQCQTRTFKGPDGGMMRRSASDPTPSPSLGSLRSLIPGTPRPRSPLKGTAQMSTQQEDGEERAQMIRGNPQALIPTIECMSSFQQDVHAPLTHDMRSRRARALERMRTRRKVTPTVGRQKRKVDIDYSSWCSSNDIVHKHNIMPICSEGPNISSNSYDDSWGSYGVSTARTCAEELSNATMMMTDEASYMHVEPKARFGIEEETRQENNAMVVDVDNQLDQDIVEKGGVRLVKYKYRQEAAKTRKRTRGRFVSEKAPAFISITELMAIRRAERERLKQNLTPYAGMA
ncbi:unnamed protein product [Choristocarpus tenellus]